MSFVPGDVQLATAPVWPAPDAPVDPFSKTTPVFILSVLRQVAAYHEDAAARRRWGAATAANPVTARRHDRQVDRHDGWAEALTGLADVLEAATGRRGATVLGEGGPRPPVSNTAEPPEGLIAAPPA
jgi:hypothetical protein